MMVWKEEDINASIISIQLQQYIYKSTKKSKKMSKPQLIIPIIDRYPFNSPQHRNNPNTKIYAKKTLENGVQSRFAMKQKIRMLKNLGFQNLIGLQSTYQQENELNLIFQYIPFEFQTKINALTSETVDKIRENMYQLAENLASHCVEHEFVIENIGLDKKNALKYYLGFNFKIDRTMKKQDTLQRYKRIIQYFFAHGGPLIKSKSPNKSNQYYQTVDTSCKLSHSEQSIHQLIPTSNLMKKSSTVPQNTIKTTMNSHPNPLTRYTFNCQNPTIPEEQRKNYDQQNTVETKAVKIEELGARINKLKTYMKQITGKTPKNTSGLSKLTVKIDSNNSDNRIFQQNKIMITPSYTQLQKKISEFRQSKLYRAYNQKEILYSRNNQGYHLHSTNKLQNNNLQSNGKPQPRYIQYDNCQTQPTSNKVKPLEERSSRVPQYLLKKKESNPSSSKNSPGNSPKNNKPCHQNSYNSGKSSALDQVQGSNMNSSKNMHIEDPQQKQYRIMAAKDKYCEQFMFFLQADQQPQFNFMCNDFSPSGKQLSEEPPKMKPNGQGNPRQIQDRVKKAIRNSIKLINGLKSKDGA